MLVLGINRINDLCRITTGLGTYTCPTKEIDGKLFFKFKNSWHSVSDYISGNTEELVKIGGRIFSRPFKE